MTKATINNDFHNTSKNIRLKEGRNVISARRMAEWKKALCCSDCCCSGVGGLRGPGSVVDEDGNYLECETTQNQVTGADELIITVYSREQIKEQAEYDAREEERRLAIDEAEGQRLIAEDAAHTEAECARYDAEILN